MTTITNTILAYSSTTQESSNSCKKTGGTDGFSALLNMVSMKPEDDKKAGAATGSTDFLSSIQQFIANIDASLFGIGNNSPVQQASAPTGLNADGTISVDALLNQGGPLPAFLDQVGARYGLDAAHKQALRDITIQFKDTTGSAAEMAQMADALKNAGIG